MSEKSEKAGKKDDGHVSCTVELRYEDGAMALAVNDAIQIDNGSFVSSTIKGNVLIARADAASVSSLLHTLDDFLACASAAEAAYGSVKKAKNKHDK